MLVIKFQMPEGAKIREVFQLIAPDVKAIKLLLENHFQVELDEPVIEEES